MKPVLISCINLAFLLYCVNAKPNAGVVNIIPRNTSKSEENTLEIEIISTNGPRTHGTLGFSIPSSIGYWDACETIEQDNDDFACIQWGDFATVHLKPGKNPSRCTRVEWASNFAREIEDCYDLDTKVHWYGGSDTHNWPIESHPRKESPYVSTGDVHENYWLLSSGAALIIDPSTPLFVSLNTTNRNKVCFIARDQTPYTERSPLTFNYEWCTGTDIKDAHQLAMSTFFDKPTDIPDKNMLAKYFWSTWAEYKKAVNQSIVIDFVKKVISKGFRNSSHVEIDDNWETCYGEEVWNADKFPDPKAMVKKIEEMDMKVTLWVHPFINYGCPRFDEAFTKGYFVKTARGKPGITDWWQPGAAGLIDVTNSNAKKWWVDRLRKIQKDTGIASFKFDAGEAKDLPSSYVIFGDDKLWPNFYTTKFVETCATFGGLVETRVAHRNQKLHIFIRMIDRRTSWGQEDNGLKSVIPTLLQFGIMGYPFVLPDMIGGNAWAGLPSKELYVRWAQVNIFMPSMQFSIVPWKYDAEVVQICLNVVAQREKYSGLILAAARQAVEDGSPINRPIWWISPNDTVTYTINDAYMLGDTIMVAPVVEEGATSRDIYLPAGTWTSVVDSEVYVGPKWLREYPAPLDVVPFFIKSN